jgi:hypothetical protein
MPKLVTFYASVALTYGCTVPSTKSGRAPITGNGEKLAGQDGELDLVGALVDRVILASRIIRSTG